VNIWLIVFCAYGQSIFVFIIYGLRSSIYRQWHTAFTTRSLKGTGRKPAAIMSMRSPGPSRRNTPSHHGSKNRSNSYSANSSTAEPDTATAAATAASGTTQGSPEIAPATSVKSTKERRLSYVDLEPQGDLIELDDHSVPQTPEVPEQALFKRGSFSSDHDHYAPTR
jgi:hypothetical protein